MSSTLPSTVWLLSDNHVAIECPARTFPFLRFSFVEKPTFSSFGFYNSVDILLEKVFRLILFFFHFVPSVRAHLRFWRLYSALQKRSFLKLKLKNSRMSSSLWKYTRHTCLEAAKQAIKYRRSCCRNLYFLSFTFNTSLCHSNKVSQWRKRVWGHLSWRLCSRSVTILRLGCVNREKSCWLTVDHKSTRRKGPVRSVQPKLFCSDLVQSSHLFVSEFNRLWCRRRDEPTRKE